MTKNKSKLMWIVSEHKLNFRVWNVQILKYSVMFKKTVQGVEPKKYYNIIIITWIIQSASINLFSLMIMITLPPDIMKICWYSFIGIEFCPELQITNKSIRNSVHFIRKPIRSKLIQTLDTHWNFLRFN